MESKKLKFTKKEKYLVSALAGLQFTHMVDFMILMPLGPVIIEQFNITNAQFSYVVSAYTFSAGISALFASTFIDRYNRKKSLLVVFLGFLFSTLLCGFSNSFYVLLAARIITGAFGGLINSMSYSIIGDSFVYERRGSAMGVVMAAFSAATVIGIPVSLMIANHFKWNYPFIVLFILGFIFMFYALYAIPLSDRIHQKHAYSDIFTNKNHYPAFFLTLTMMLSGFSIIPYISIYLVFNTVMTQADLPMMYLFGGVATYGTSRFFGYLSDKYGKKIMFYIIAGASVIPVFFISHINASYSIPVILFITTVFFIFISGRWVPAMALITSVVDPKIRGSFMTFNTAVQQMGSGLATLISGRMISQQANHVMQGFGTVSYFSIVMTSISIGCVYLIKLYNVSPKVPE
ncbi:MAG: MFS transporter [Spirochaetia bacterium]|nr:MFS transporter [Spirochaetia bacterium]